MAHPYQPPDASFTYSQHNPQHHQLPPPPPPAAAPPSIPSAAMTKPRKAKRNRKKHPPVGPAGNWFLSRNSNHSKTTNSSNIHPSDSPPSSQDEQSATATRSSVVANPAWMAMQCALQWLTPDLPLPWTPVQRYKRLRAHVPRDYTLLPQIVQHATKWKLPADQKLVVLVLSVSCHHDDIWTVELQDDTGATIQAWMQPSFVQTEKQQHADNATGPHYIRPGYVWCLEHVTVMLQNQQPQQPTTTNDFEDDDNPEHAKKQRRMLLISERNVTRVWTPDSLQQIQEHVFCQWMEQRNEFQRQWEEAELASNPRSRSNNINSIHAPGGGVGTSTSAATTGRGNNGDESSEEEEEDDEDRYRRQQQQHFASRRASLPHEDEEDTAAVVVGGPIIRSLHTGGSAHKTTPTRSMLFGSQKQQHSHSASHHSPQPASGHIPRPHLHQSQQPRVDEKEANDGDVTDMLMRSLMNQSQSPHLSQTAVQPDPQRNGVSNSVTPGQPSTVKSAQPSRQHSPYHQPPTPQHQHQNQMVQQQSQQGLSGNVWDNRTNVSQIGQGQQPSHGAGVPNAGGSRRVSFSQLPAPPSIPYPSQTQCPPSQPRTLQSGPRNQNKENQHQATRPTAGRLQDTLQSTIDNETPTLDLSQFSATVGNDYVSPLPTKPKSGPSCDPTSDEKATKGPSPAEETTPPPKKRSKDKSKRKKKKARYDESPLSQSPKPSTAKLWTATGLFGAAGLLDLSSDDEDEDKSNTTRVQHSENKKVEETAKSLSKDSNAPKVAIAAFASKKTSNIFGGGSSSIFQATSLPGMAWMGLSDDDDD